MERSESQSKSKPSASTLFMRQAKLGLYRIVYRSDARARMMTQAKYYMGSRHEAPSQKTDD